MSNKRILAAVLAAIFYLSMLPSVGAINWTFTDNVTVQETLTAADLITKSPWIDVRAYGAVGDGVTEDTVAIQAAFDAAYTSWLPVFFPAGHYYTDTIDYKGQSMFGVGGSNPGETDSGTIIRGKPGKDVFLVADGSDEFMPNSHIHDMKIYVDGTEDASATYGRATYDALVIGNAAFAAPWSDAADWTKAFNNATFERLIIEQYGGETYNYSNKTAGFYFANAPYQCTFNDIVIHVTEYGYVNAPQHADVNSNTFAPDANLFNRIALTCKYNFVAYGGSHNKIKDMQIYNSGSADHRAFFLYSYTNSLAATTYPYYWIVSGLYIENDADSTGANSIIQGKQHVFLGGNMKQDGASNCYIQWDAHWSTMIGVGMGSDLLSSNPSLVVNGDGNIIDISIWHTRQSVVKDNGVGNIIQFRNEIYNSERIRGVYPHRPILYHQTPDWMESASAPYESKNDLVFYPEDINSGTSTTDQFTITKDSSVPISRAYLTIPSADNTWSASFFNGDAAEVGTRIPKTKARLYIRAKAGASVTHRIRVFSDVDTAGDSTFSLTTSWTTFSMPVDFSAATDGDNFSLYGSDTSAPTDIDIAWIAIRPYADDLYSLGDLTIDTDGKGVVMTNAAGTVTKRVRLNDAGNGLLYEDP